MAETVLTHLSKKVQEEMEVFERDTILGKAKTFEDYKFSCGVYRGLAIANGIIADLAQQMRIEEDED